MNYGQNFRFGFYYAEPYKRMQAIKDAGFTHVMQWWGDAYEETDGDKYDICEYAKDCGLKYSALHAPSTRSSDIWINDEKRQSVVDMYINVVENCNRLHCPSMVMHLTKKFELYEPNEYGLDSISQILKVAEQQGVNVAIENTRFLMYNDYIFKNLKSDKLKACYDSGHNNCYTPDVDVIPKYADKIVVTHLHDNYGKNEIDQLSDQHNLIGSGTVDWIEVSKKLKKLNLDVINLESYYNYKNKVKPLGMVEYLNLSYKKIQSLMEKGILIDT